MTGAPEAFGRRLDAAMRARGPFCAGIDPHPGLLEAWGLSDDVAGLERFARTAVEALGETVALLKPQSAFFERHGSRGVAVLERVLADAKGAGALVLLDVKRGDIGSTMQAYADAYCDPASPLCADAVTVSPYLGFESLRPVLDTAAAHGNGVFVLALTSNPEGPEVQHARGADGRTVAGTVLDHVRAANAAALAAGDALGSVGVVVGATTGGSGEDLAVGGPLLAPGIGAQGATVADLATVFGAALPQVVPSASREVLSAGPDPRALRAAAAKTIEDVRDLLFRASAGA
ncbi:orotidine-5'-phosphate decarboxylase [Jiangella rhizosphaerae]|uniref:Orotidine 5'-phosphate decarboxylase n=1 Tax=Jiangella rhizosphaerae TaxID=2293569 RepID=A0A418KR62_9ACTN|nr:orotidine-5'-phosphate decarboxylase [Jiangella rhizosphaerae]RIQ23902.1 orotidine-5'-phosphate decarboxylase [Jiangella rhizosphaerae]